ncbi:MAG: hypothetical protein ACOC2W_01190 [bacterium]
MTIFRSYFSKNNTLIGNELTNNSQNPVTEISYGTYDKQVSRFIFDVNFAKLQERIDDGFINPDKIVKHTLHLTNTINNSDDYIGKKSYSNSIERASSFKLDVFNIDEEWHEGSGYDFIYNSTLNLNLNNSQASNWFERKQNVLWDVEGYYQSGVTEIIGSQSFDNGNENLEIDVTDYINDRLFNTGNTSNGLGVKFDDLYESLETEFRQAVAFHTKYTHTFYAPYIETIIDDTINDDRNYFYLDKDNSLYMYVNIGGFKQNIDVDYVEIYDYQDNMIDVISGDSVENVSKGVYKINLNLDSRLHPDSVLYRDVWHLTINDRDVVYDGNFYLINPDNYYSINNTNEINFDNYYFKFHGISENENVSDDVIKKIKLTIRELYPNQNNYLPLNIEYRLYSVIAGNHEIDVIPFTPVNRTNTGYEFNLDTSWLIPQDYHIEIRMGDGNYFNKMQKLSFTVTSNNVIKY